MTQLNIDQVFATTASRACDFQFTAEIAKVFDDMLVRSVPFYSEQQFMIKELAKKFHIKDTRVYDLGCSTGTTLISLAQEIGGDAGPLIGYDNSFPMIEKARANIAQCGLDGAINIDYADLNGAVSLENASVVTMCWTLQFVRPLQRTGLTKQVYNGLVENGVLILMEKVLTNNTDMNRLFIETYYEFKKRNGYSNEEIAKKREALENVLVPYRIEENIELLKRSGFEMVETFFQWYNFVGFLCVKKG